MKREYTAEQAREDFPATSLPKWLDEAIPVVGFVVCFGMAVLFVALGWA